MGQDVHDEAYLRKYLLGMLNEAEQQAIEERLMADGAFFDLLHIAEDELIDHYLEPGALSTDQRSRFENFFLSTPDRRRQLQFAMALKSYVTAEVPTSEASASVVTGGPSSVIPLPTSLWKRVYSSPYLRVAAAVFICLGLGVGFWRLFVYQSEVDKGMNALVKAFGKERPLESQITGLGYAPLPNTRGSEPPKADVTSLRRGELILLEETDKHPTAAAQHALGRLLVMEKRFGEGIAHLEEAVKADPDNARINSDLGASMLEYGRSLPVTDPGGRVDEAYARSLKYLNRALTLDPQLREALFNRALLHEQMTLADRAIEDWRAYLEKDSTSPWADEARQHLGRLEEKQRQAGESRQNTVADFLSAFQARDSERAWALFGPNREKIINELLAAYLKDAGERAAISVDYAFQAMTYVGELEAERAGDHYTTDLTRFYGSASAEQLAVAGEARRLTSEAQQVYSKAVERAADLRARSRDLFSGIGDRSSAQLATYWLALHDWELGRTAQSLSLFDSLLRDCDADGHLWLRARALHLRGGIAFKFGEYSSAISYEDEARQMAVRINDPALASNARSAVIEHYRALGNQSACFREISGGRQSLGEPTLPLLCLWRQYDTLATAFYTFDYYDAAIDYEREALKFAEAVGDFVTIASCKAHLGLSLGKLGRSDEALDIVQQAYELGLSHAEQSLGPAVMAYATLQKGQLYRSQGDVAEAREFYDQTVNLHRQYNLDFPARLYQAYKGRLACYLTLNDTGAAEEQLATLLDLMNQNRAKILEEENRDSFFDSEQSVYDMGIDLAYSKLHDPARAFEYAEVSRARSLLDSLNGNARVIELPDKLDVLLEATAQPLPLAQIQSRIPSGARLLEYAVLDDKLLVWIVTRTDTAAVVVAVESSRLTSAVNRFVDLIQRSDSDRQESDREGRALFDYLIAPVETLIRGCQTLIIIPDKTLNKLPWDALISPQSGRFLLEDYLVTLAPSATLYALCTDVAAAKAGRRSERILSVGDPLMDQGEFPQLRKLDSAAREAKSISQFYSAPALLLGPNAREAVIRAEMVNCDVAHFAVHCIVDDASPMRSSLILARETAGAPNAKNLDGRLHAYEIYGSKLKRMRLTVLSACQTGVERYYRGEGMIGMARAFLVARVPVVVASLWAVDSDATAELMIRFHRYRKHDASSTSEEALWKAKRSLLLDQDGRYHNPSYWAAFEIIGGHASF
ncbi:MAG TPA: CHAT domain-containing protein [Blastocatellia bacterium]|nr:CHAT domain-containing protein [Blastocatellia bacterium]